MENELSEYDEKYEQHRLLSTLLSADLTGDEKLGIARTDHSISADGKSRKDMSVMCNLSQGIRENATDNAITGVIMNMHRDGCSSEQIAGIVEKTN